VSQKPLLKGRYNIMNRKNKIINDPFDFSNTIRIKNIQERGEGITDIVNNTKVISGNINIGILTNNTNTGCQFKTTEKITVDVSGHHKEIWFGDERDINTIYKNTYTYIPKNGIYNCCMGNDVDYNNYYYAKVNTKEVENDYLATRDMMKKLVLTVNSIIGHDNDFKVVALLNNGYWEYYCFFNNKESFAFCPNMIKNNVKNNIRHLGLYSSIYDFETIFGNRAKEIVDTISAWS